ncbi:hypothetical protein DPMN_086555 [Dreissena polymorpha]|uniref:Uncharacterized protein n=2 Tax=Dreissena polymorpha TaxID=45954 RepID=A0A9D4KQN4_DREPO|nr:hypothetical protein DPMN_086555 [Dreissena polymorpha]
MEKYEAALSVLQKEGPSLKLATLYHKIGRNVYKQGNIVDSITYYKKSLAISATRGKNYASVMLYTLSLTGASYVFLGQFDMGEKYHNRCYKRIEQLHGKIHPTVGHELDKIGLLHDQRGDTLTGLEYFLRGLDVKRRSNAAHFSIVYSLSNVANSYNTLRRFDEAHDNVDEAFEILEKHPVPHMDALSLMYNTRGKIYSNQEKWQDAEVAFRKCVEITRTVDDKSFFYMKRLVNLAEVQEKRNRLQACLRTASQAHALSERTIKTAPHVFIIMECLQCMCRVYRMLDKNDKFIETLKEMEVECIRLRNVYAELENQTKQKLIVKLIEDVKQMWTEVKYEKLE